MLMTSLYAIISVSLLSAIALCGVFALSMRKETLDSMVSYLVALAAGAMLGNGLFHLIPESFEHADDEHVAALLIISGVIGCFLLEKWLNLRCHSNGTCGLEQGESSCACKGKHTKGAAHDHGHDHEHENEGHDHGHSHGHKPVRHMHPGGHGHAHRAEYIHPTGWMSLFSHSIHNFGDGMLIAASYMISIPAGLATTAAIILHEIPMELGEFGVLVNAGFKRKTAVLVNAVSGVVALIGTILTLWIGSEIPGLDSVLTPVGAGCVLYIATCGLMPQLQKENCVNKSRKQFLIMLAGIAIMFALSHFAHAG